MLFLLLLLLSLLLLLIILLLLSLLLLPLLLLLPRTTMTRRPSRWSRRPCGLVRPFSGSSQNSNPHKNQIGGLKSQNHCLFSLLIFTSTCPLKVQITACAAGLCLLPGCPWLDARKAAVRGLRALGSPPRTAPSSIAPLPAVCSVSLLPPCLSSIAMRTLVPLRYFCSKIWATCALGWPFRGGALDQYQGLALHNSQIQHASLQKGQPKGFGRSAKRSSQPFRVLVRFPSLLRPSPAVHGRKLGCLVRVVV